MEYNISHKNVENAFYGLQYDSCCYAVRVVASRSFDNLNENNNPEYNDAVYVQFLLKGLGSLGTSDTGDDIMENIPGYVDNFANRLV